MLKALGQWWSPTPAQAAAPESTMTSGNNIHASAKNTQILIQNNNTPPIHLAALGGEINQVEKEALTSVAQPSLLPELIKNVIN